MSTGHGEDTTLVCAQAERCLLQYSLGIMRIDVDLMGGDPLNRQPSAKHVHSLWKNIVDHQSFQRHRYNHLIAVDTHPEQPQRVIQWCRTWERLSDGLLPTPTGKESIGVLAHQHLLYGMKGFRHGGLKWEGTQEAMQAPRGEKGDTIRDHLQHGMFVNLLRHEALDEDPEGVAAIVQSYNLDQGTCLAQSEMEVLKKMVTQVRGVHVPRGALLEDVVIKATIADTGGRFSSNAVHRLYNFALTIDEEHMQFLSYFHFHYVNPGQVTVRPTFFGEVAASTPKGVKYRLRWMSTMSCFIQLFRRYTIDVRT